VRDTSTSPSGSTRVMNAFNFSLDPVISKTKLSVVESTTRARKMSGETERLDARLAFARNLDQRHLALDKGLLVSQIVDRNEPRKLSLDLLDDHPRSRGHDHRNAQ
jgi:hypothetical protein